MSRIFDLDGPVLGTLNKIADLLWLNILTIICCLPVFTIGASLSAAHYVCLKLYRGEEGYVTKDFFKAFKMNFAQGSALGVLCLVLAAVFITDFVVTNKNFAYYIELPQIFHILIMAAFILYLFFLAWVFPVQAKFINTIPKTIKNAFALSMVKFPQTIAMIVVYACPWVALWLTDFYLVPVVFMFGLSVPIFCSAALYSKFFQKLEDNIRAKQEQNESTEGELEEGPETEEPAENSPEEEE